MSYELHRLEESVDKLVRIFEKILSIILKEPFGMVIKQIKKGDNMAITGTPAGGTSTFQEVPTPAGAVFPAGTTFVWTVDDTADISLTPSTDGTQCSTACSATPTGTSYNLTCTSNFTPTGATAPASGTVNVPILPGSATTTPTGLTINQLS
jgi:hypothetical protein